MFVRLNDRALADEFVGYLRRADCVADLGEVEAHAEGIAVRVEVPRAYDDAQARMEVALYLRLPPLGGTFRGAGCCTSAAADRFRS